MKYVEITRKNEEIIVKYSWDDESKQEEKTTDEFLDKLCRDLEGYNRIREEVGYSPLSTSDMMYIVETALGMTPHKREPDDFIGWSIRRI